MTSPIAYFNGQFTPLKAVNISPLDRGFLFGDGAYEVIPVHNGQPFCLEAHIDRLDQSLLAIRLPSPHTIADWKNILETLVNKNGDGDQLIYLQVTRGVDKIRDHQFPNPIVPTLFAYSYPKIYASKSEQSLGIKTISVKDIRWKHCHIKTTARIAYVLLLQQAKEQGCDEGIIMNTGYALEGTTTNVFIVRHGVIMTPPKAHNLLHGITRDYILSLAEKNKMPYRETKISERELLNADEIWLTGSGRGISPVVELDANPVGNGKAGPLWDKMWDLYATDINKFSL
jgi:D-alanine transaminase